MEVKIAQEKKDEVSKLTQLMQDYSVIGIADITSLPSAQFQTIRKKLKDHMLIRTTKKRLLKIVIKQLKVPGIKKLESSLEKCMPAIILTKDNPFRLSKLLSQNKSKVPARLGQIAPKDLIIPAGLTNFGPGPIIGELGSAGIKSIIESGKIVVKEDKLLVKEGEEISQKQANILSKFGIEPMEIGINVISLLESGILYSKEILEVDEKGYLNKLAIAHSNALNLVLSTNIIIKEIIQLKLLEAHKGALALASSKCILTSETLKIILSKAESQASVLKFRISEVKEENKSEKISEESLEDDNQGGN